MPSDTDRWETLRASVETMFRNTVPATAFSKGMRQGFSLVLDEMETIELAEPVVSDG